MLQLIQIFFDENFISNGYGYLWELSILRLNIASEFIIIFSYLSISLLLAYFLRQRPDIPFHKIFWLFCAFILACSTTHLLELWTVWYPNYGFSSLFKAIAAGVAFYMAKELVHLIPKALGLPNLLNLERANQALAQEIQSHRQTETELQAFSQRFSLLVQQTPLAVIEWTPNFEVVDWNPAAEKIFGYSKSEVLGRQAIELIVPDSIKEQMYQVGQQLLRQKGGTRSTNENCTKEGRQIYCEWYNTPLINAEGQVIGIASLCQDITDRQLAEEALQQAKNQLEIRVEERTQELRQALAELKEVILQLQGEIEQRQQVEASLREREEQYRSVVDNVKEVIFQTDIQGYWTFLNPAWSEITDFAIADTLGSLFLNYVHPDDRQRNLNEFQLLLEGKQEYYRHEVRYQTACGNSRWIEVFAQLTFDANRTITGTCGTLYDITERHLSEAALAERERYLAALVEVQRRLLAFERDTQQEFIKPKPYQEILQLLGQVSGASRAYIFENHQNKQGRLLMSQKAEWCAPGISPKIDEPMRQNVDYENFFPRWEQLLSQNEIIAAVVAEFPESERVLLEREGILSILILPLTVHGAFFGFIGFDNCTLAHPWQASEIDLLRSAAAAVSLWNESVLAQQALRQSEAANRALLEAIPDALLRIHRNGTYIDFIPAKNSHTPIPTRAFLGKKIAEVLPQELAIKVSADVEAAFSTGKVQVSEAPIRLKGEQRHYEIRTVFYGEDEVLMIGRDITEQKQAEAALRESEERFRSLVDHIPGVVYRCAYDDDWTMDFMSDVIEEMSGYPATDFLHNQVRTFASLIAIEDRARIQQVISECVAQRKPYVLEYRLIRKDGTVRWVYQKGQAVFAADSSLLCLDGVIFDITDYRQTQEELRLREEQFRQLTENIREVFFLTLPDLSQILYISPAYEELWGRTTQSLYEQPLSWLDGVHPEDRDRLGHALTEHLQQVQDFDQEYRVVRPDGSVRWVWVRACHILNPVGASERIAGIAEDITERKLAEVEILNALSKEKELGDLKSRFISITSHEFRTPLATIMSTAELLEYYEWTKEEQVEQLHLIQEAVKHMLQLLEDSLFIGTAEAGQVRFNPEPLVLDEFCQELVTEIQRGMSLNPTPSGIQHTLTLVCQGHRFLACMDKKLLRQLLSNLLSNAIKYSPAGGQVHLTLTCQDDTAIFQIEDQGIGIPKEDQSRLFEFFYRAKNVGAIAGTGLGLAIVKTCVDLHRGEIAVESEVGRGTKFTVSLPLKNHFSFSVLNRLPPHTILDFGF